MTASACEKIRNTGDLGDWEYLGEQAVTADESCVCDECGGVVPEGTPHILHRWVSHGKEGQAVVCPLCEELRGFVCARLGLVREKIKEMARQGRIDLRDLDNLSPAARDVVAGIVDAVWLAEAMKEGVTRAEKSRAIIKGIVARVGREDDERLRAELRAAYPFGQRAQHPYRIWRREIRSILGPAPVRERRAEVRS